MTSFQCWAQRRGALITARALNPKFAPLSLMTALTRHFKLSANRAALCSMGGLQPHLVTRTLVYLLKLNTQAVWSRRFSEDVLLFTSRHGWHHPCRQSDTESGCMKGCEGGLVLSPAGEDLRPLGTEWACFWKERKSLLSLIFTAYLFQLIWSDGSEIHLRVFAVSLFSRCSNDTVCSGLQLQTLCLKIINQIKTIWSHFFFSC